MTYPTSTPRPPRLRSLDGCRGLAALIVVIHHSALTVPDFANLYFTRETPAEGTLLWWLNATPLKIFTAGGEAVLLFFVLSGLVVSLPVLRAKSFDWIAYYVARTLRLWVPVAASLLLASLWVTLVTIDPATTVSKWVSSSDVPLLEWQEVVRGFDAVRGPTRINNPLWSLQWEFLFSLLLPVFVGIAVVLRRWTVATTIACTALSVVGAMNEIGFMTFLSAFLAGAVMAFPVMARTRRYRPRRTSLLTRAGWFGCFSVGVLLMCAYWPMHIGGVTDPLTLAIGKALSIPGAVLIVLCAVFSRTATRFLEWGLIQWLGKISFSLYLVHVPIILLFSRLLGADHWMRALLFAIPISVVVAWLFSKVVELPAHRLSKRAGRFASAKFREYVSSSHAAGEAPSDAAGVLQLGTNGSPAPPGR
ncbi:acyltransferase family protein [Pseudarthrobacter cellobiosi]|uniref:acyltransferase family protein n=1 Tax=Pseudarthrobacter cellobiosi TaxID=2953654 RepID=UPI00208F689F|nr:acyltransferase [Pseudarthrobacter sp. HLT1-5]MCO4257339.1 acyltransferase [Pseudarthrobacter sp. HLT1-5]